MSTAPTRHALSGGRAKGPHAKKPLNRGNPQRSSSQEINTNKFLKPKSNSLTVVVGPVETVENVENRLKCERQVFSTMEVAQGMVGTLKGLGISAKAAKCLRCGLIHVIEGAQP